jgi:phage terminase large subunit GpA-like protein
MRCNNGGQPNEYKEGTQMKHEGKEDKSARSKDVVLALISKMIEYQVQIDEKQQPTDSEIRHVQFLRSLRNSALSEPIE